MSNRDNVIVRNVHFLAVIGRLENGVTLDALRTRLDTIALRLAESHPASNTGWGAVAVPLHEQVVGAVRRALLVLLVGVGVVLLMAVVNVANLALARSIRRRRELAVRTALGAGRGRLMRQMLTESILLSLTGSLVALLFVRWGVQALVALAPATMPRVSEVHPDLT